LDNGTPKECIPCLGYGVATCTAETGATITTTVATSYENCMDGFFFTGLGSYTVNPATNTSTLIDGSVVVTGIAAVT